MHRPLDQEHAAAVWLIGRGTLGPKKMRVPLVTLLAALPTLPAIVVLLTLPIIFITLLNLHLPLSHHQITELAGAKIIRHQ